MTQLGDIQVTRVEGRKPGTEGGSCFNPAGCNPNWPLLSFSSRCCQGNARHTPGSPWTGKLIQHCMLQRTAAVWTDYFQEKGRLAVLLLLLPLTQPGHIGPYLKHHSSALLQQVEQKGKYPLLQSLQSKSVFFFFNNSM